MLRKHQEELGRIPGLRVVGPEYHKTGLMRALEAVSPQILYLYCHGDRNPAISPPTVLRLGWKGHESFVYATDMSQLVEAAEPLVFINGCHTLDADPDDLVSFNKSLSEGGAAAVIGTEIKVPEELAALAGESLLTSLLEGNPLGKAMHEFRLALLLNKNPLGLAYTTYGFSDLTIHVG